MTRGWSQTVLTPLRALIALPRPARRGLAIAVDAAGNVAATWLAFALRLGVTDWPAFGDGILLLGASALAAWLPAAVSTGVYKDLVRFSGARALVNLALACVIMAVPLLALFGLHSVPGVPRTTPVLQPIIFFIYLILTRLGIRFVALELLENLQVARGSIRNVLIYGAGRGGRQLADSLRQEKHLRLAGYVDDDPRLRDQRLNGVLVYHTAELDRLLADFAIDEVMIAIPSLGRARRAEIVQALKARKVAVRLLPGVGQLISGDVTVSDVRPVAIDDLLGRDAVPPNPELLGRSLHGKSVVVTGAGGSIGSELCRQIVRQKPRLLVLIENSEFALYSIEAELRAFIAANELPIALHPELANAAQAGMMERLFARYAAQTVYHAAAYKHVPLVEGNPVSGLTNNVFGTLASARAAERTGVERFILVSTDKAVRPTNVMGATKRICELVVQALAAKSRTTIFSMVRFGNVLGSSGSVVPLFRRQIAQGGPVTVTHRDVTRYFMTIPEAAQLVIQAGGMARGGEVFVLDMGESIRILDLARTMIDLSGLSVRDADNPEGDIEIAEVGLRPGEKLYEELLIGNNPVETAHRRIMQASEHFIAWDELVGILDQLEGHLGRGESEDALAILRRLVPEYRPDAAGAPPPSAPAPASIVQANADASLIGVSAADGAVPAR